VCKCRGQTIMMESVGSDKGGGVCEDCDFTRWVRECALRF
jgi:hypothetical protein